jgi:hypothetical protein
VLLLGVGLTVMIVPVATLNYDGRFGIPAHGLVAASGSIGALWAVGAVRAALAGRRRARAGLEAEPA